MSKDQSTQQNGKQKKTADEQRGTSRTLYFANRANILSLVDHLHKYPRANLSSIFGQLVEPLNKALTELPPGQRSIDLNLKIWL